jgi:tetratricopeptide (TPR) repeat protein
MTTDHDPDAARAPEAPRTIVGDGTVPPPVTAAAVSGTIAGSPDPPRPPAEAPPARAAPLLPPGYEWVGELGRGGMGVVYRARQTALKREVALKVVLAGGHASDEDRDRFLREAEAAAALNHPGVVGVYESGTCDGQPYLALEFCPGGSLAQRLAGTPLPPREAAALVERVARAIAAAHARGIVHRDVKPANVLLAADGTPKVADFGLAKAVESGAGTTATGAVLGTPSYMAPEQARGEARNVGPLADVYALGAVLYECLSGRPPFRAATAAATLLQVLDDEPVAVRTLNPAVPRDVETIALKALEKVPDRRYPSAGALADELRRWLAGEPILARPAGPVERGWKWVRRNAVVSAAVAAVFLALATGGGVATWQAVRARTAAREEARAKTAAEQRTELLLAIFRDLDPRTEEKDGRPLRVTLGERLDRAAELLDRDSGDRLTVARLRLDLGSAQIGLGNPDRAIVLLTRSAEDCAALLGADAPETLAGRSELASAYQAAGRYADAEPLIRDVLRAREAALGPDDPSTVRAMNNLGTLLTMTGRSREAVDLLGRAVRTAEGRHPPDHPEVLQLRANLAAALRELGRYAEAAELLDRVLRSYAAALGPDHSTTLLMRNNLATVQQLAGQPREAAALFEQTLRGYESRLGPDHPDTLRTLNNLAVALCAIGRSREAEEILRRALASRERRFALDHPETLMTRGNLGEVYRVRGRPGEAAELLERVLQSYAATLGPDHPDALTVQSNLALAYKQLGRQKDTIEAFERLHAAQGRTLGADHPATLKTRNNLAATYYDAGRPCEAADFHLGTLKLAEGKLAPDHPTVLMTRTNLATAYHDLGWSEEAERLLEDTLPRAAAVLGPNHPDTALIRENLAFICAARGRDARAAEVLEESLRLDRAEHGPDRLNPDVIRPLAAAYRRLGRKEDVTRLWGDAVRAWEPARGPADAATLAARNGLGIAHFDLGHFREAAGHFEQALKGYEANPALDPVATLTARGNLIDALLADGQAGRAVPLVGVMVAARQEEYGSDDPRFAAALAFYAGKLLDHHRPADAEPLARECLAVREKNESDRWKTANAKSLLGGALLGQRKFAEAEPLVLAGYEGLKSQEAKIPPEGKQNLPKAARRVVDLYEGWGKPDRAAEWRARLATDLPKPSGPPPPGK